MLTRSLDSTFLHGVTRDSVLTLARKSRYRVEERMFDVPEMLEWVRNGEAALSGTAAVLAGVGTFVHRGQEHRVGSGEVGPHTRKLRERLVSIQRGESRTRTAGRRGCEGQRLQGSVPFYGPEEVRATLDYDGCIAAVRAAMADFSAEDKPQPLRSIVEIAPGKLFGLMPGTLAAPHGFGAKVLSVFADPAHPGRSAHRGVVVLFYRENGHVTCIADAGEVTETARPRHRLSQPMRSRGGMSRRLLYSVAARRRLRTSEHWFAFDVSSKFSCGALCGASPELRGANAA